VVWYSLRIGLVDDVNSLLYVAGNILFIGHHYFNWGFIFLSSVALRCLLSISLSLSFNLSLIIVDLHGGRLFMVSVVDLFDLVVIFRSCFFGNFFLLDNFVVRLWSIFIGFDLLFLFFLDVFNFHLSVLLLGLGFNVTVFLYGLDFSLDFDYCFRVLTYTVLFGFFEVLNHFSDFLFDLLSWLFNMGMTVNSLS
jgi:hypothetical protein